jgi:hypothetical protein
VAVKDLLNALVVVILFLASDFFVKNKSLLIFFRESLIRFIIIIASIISLLWLMDLFDIISFSNYFFTNDISGNYPEYSNALDYNFALLPAVFGILCILYFLRSTKSLWHISTLNLLLILFLSDIALSGSKRGLGIVIAIFLFIAACWFISLFSKVSYFKAIGSGFRYMVLSISLMIIVVISFLNIPSYLKDKTLDIVGTKSKLTARIKVTSYIMRYVSVYDKKTIYPELFEKIWKIKLFDPKEPRSGWATRIHKDVFPLTGRNSELIPEGTKGYMMDSTCDASTWDGNSFSFTIFGTREIAQGKTGKASVYCFVSDDFNGTWAMLALVGKDGSFIASDEYNLKEKNTWQKLEIDVLSNPNNSGLSMYFSKFGVSDFRLLTGFIIFAYPYFDGFRMEVIPEGRVDVSHGSTSMINITYNNSSFLPLNIIDIFQNSDKKKSDPDLVRNIISNIVHEDTVYRPYKASLSKINTSGDLFSLRTARWRFGWNIFSQEYNAVRKVFGGGFSFLNWYGYMFLNDQTASDWPHNPFLQILLYSGLLGLIIYMLFLTRSFYFYIKYFKEFGIFFNFFLITFFFSFFSGGSPFDPPIMGFFSILPFFIHAVHKRSSGHTSESSMEEKAEDAAEE